MPAIKLHLLKNPKQKIELHTYLLFVFCFVYYTTDQHLAKTNDDYEPMFQDFTTCVYYTIVTQFTVGYGDISPKHKLVKSLCSLHIILSFIFTLL